MNRVVLIAIVLLILAIWFGAFVNACAPRPAFGGGFWNPPIIIGGGWNQGGWDRGSSSSSSGPAIPAPSRSSGGSIRGGGISGGSGGK